MNASAQPSPAAMALRQRVIQAVLAQDMPAALRLLAEPPPPGDAELDQIAVRLYTASQRWDHASAVLARMDGDDLQVRVKLNLARNLAAMSRHRPELYDQLVNTPAPGLHKLHRLPDGQMTLLRQTADGKATLCLSADDDPQTATDQRLAKLQPALQRGEAVALGGVGDGHLLASLGRHRPTLMHQQQVAIHVIEPLPEVLMHAMMIHDYTGPQGCIEQPRFIFHVGQDWSQRYADRLLRAEPFLPQPCMLVQLDQAVTDARAVIAGTLSQSNTMGAQLVARQHARYAGQDRQDWAALFSAAPPRQPRVMVMTSRFTTVLRYEAVRIADAMTALGWAARVVMEPADHHRILALGVRQAIEDHQPDLLITLDHLRHEQGQLIPQDLPCLCWVQDLLPNLTTPDAGRAVDDLQWVISFCTPLLVNRYGYPADRCLDAPIMLASTPDLPDHWEQDGPDLAYVSNLSQDEPALINATLAGVSPADHDILRACCERIVSHYHAGGSLSGKPAIGRLVHGLLTEHFARHGATMPVEHAIAKVIDKLSNPLNIALYRQQALRWVAQVAREEGLTLAIFGRGWESHPDFAPHARGVIEPGKPLQDLIRSTRLNLNLEPYPCTSHVRLLDGLTAGGFHLIRRHPADAGMTRLATFLDRYAPHAQSDAQALSALPRAHHAALRQRLDDAADICHDHPPDVVAQLRACQRAGMLADDHIALPHLDDVSFDSLATCRQRIMTFLHDASARRRISQAQRLAVLDRLTLRQGLRRMLDQMSRSLAGHTAGASPAPQALSA